MASTRFQIARAESGRPAVDLLRERLALPLPAARRLFRDGRVRLQGRPCADPATAVASGQVLEVLEATSAGPAPLPAAAAEAAPTVHYLDEHLAVVDKPPGITTVRSAEDEAEFGPHAHRFLPPTLADRLPALLGRPGGLPVHPIAVHRLDRDTSGLVVFALTPGAASHLGRQFRAHTVERLYLALVRGRAQDARIESRIARDRGDGRRGAGADPTQGQQAVTHVRVVEMLGDSSLVECRLETGRTHQVRIHLGEAGTPLCGERLYDRPLHGRPAADTSGAPRTLLHAATLGFAHPATGRRLSFRSPLPADMAGVLEELRRRASL